MNTNMILNKGGKSGIQSSILASVKSRIPYNISFPDELAGLLNISKDSAYRRIREETILSLDEVKILCDRYNVSIDSLMMRDSGNVSFELRAGSSFQSWLESTRIYLERLESVSGADMIWHSRELPVFHFFQFPKLAAFKVFMCIQLSSGEDFRGKYDERPVDSKLMSFCEKIWDQYASLPSTEIVGRELIQATLRQIEYGFDVGLIGKDQALSFCSDCTALINQLQQQVQYGHKRVSNKEIPPGKFDVYLNDLMTGDNTILFRMGKNHTTFITYTNFNVLTTSNDSFCTLTEEFIQGTIRKSVLISRAAEKERVKFFNRIYRQIEEVKSALEG